MSSDESIEYLLDRWVRIHLLNAVEVFANQVIIQPSKKVVVVLLNILIEIEKLLEESLFFSLHCGLPPLPKAQLIFIIRGIGHFSSDVV